MADETEAGATTPVQPKMRVLGQFIRDLSFENILSQKGATGEVQPQLQVQIAIDGKRRPTENQYELVMKFQITSKNAGSDDVLFILEIDYGAIFEITDIPEEQVHPYLLIECPRVIFPFVRRIVSDITRDGGFPAVNLEMVDFIQLYRQQLAARAAQSQKSADAPVN